MTSTITKQQLSDIVQYKDIFSSKLYSIDKSISLFDKYVYSQEIFDLMMAFTRSGFIIDFHWEFYEGDAQFYFEQSARISKMSIINLQKLVTYIFKKNEKQSEIIARAIDRGVLKSIMARIEILYNSIK